MSLNMFILNVQYKFFFYTYVLVDREGKEKYTTRSTYKTWCGLEEYN